MPNDDSFEHPARIGPYRVVQVIGEGGMGLVYEAEQKEPVRRRVAVKMMKVGMDTKEVVGRFEAERQALAVMDHPGIARVFDAGATDRGRPYFVMELVRGVRIDHYCDRERLTTRDRVRLFVDVCEAVQHAHQKGVIHRDLKPSNILVSEDGGRPAPKVIDFGVAKATGQRLTDRTVVTTHGQAIGTLAYMSPEQAEMSGLDVDTRTDVYALSVILYELLTGRLPMDPKELGGPAFLGMLIQRENTFPTLVEGLSKLERQRLETVAAIHGTDSAGLRRQLGGDLQWIVMKGMEKDRGRRYETANALAMDLQRYLDDEPVRARPPTAGYRLGKFVRRNAALTAAAAFAASALTVGAVASTVGMLRARAAEESARMEAATAARVSDFLEGLFRVNDPSEARGSAITAREILDAGAERIRTELHDQPEVRARLLATIASVYGSLGLTARSEELLRASLQDRQAGGVGSDTRRARALLSLAQLVADRGADAEADTLYAAALRTLEEDDPGSVQHAITLRELGFHEVVIHGDYQRADSLVRLALSMAEETLGPDNAELTPFLSTLALLHDDDPEFAEPLQRRVLAILERTLGWDHPETLSAGHNLHLTIGRRPETADEAERLMRRVLEGTEAVYGIDNVRLARVRTDFALFLNDFGRATEAMELMRPAVATLERALGESAPETAWARHHLGRALLSSGEVDEGTAQIERSVRDLEDELGRGHHYTAQALTTLAELRSAAGRTTEAERLYLEALATLEETFGGGHELLVEPLLGLGELQEQAGDLGAADTTLARAATVCRSELGERHPCAERAVDDRVRVLRALGREREAEELAAEHARRGTS